MNIGALRNTIALCTSTDSCTCFDRFFAVKSFYNSQLNEIDYIDCNLPTLHQYRAELVKHMNKDLILNQSNYQTIAAGTLKKAFEHHLETLQLFERYFFKNCSLMKKIFYCKFLDKTIPLFTFITTIRDLTIAQNKFLVILNSPNLRLDTKRHFEVIDLHLFVLQLFNDLIISNLTTKQHGTIFF